MKSTPSFTPEIVISPDALDDGLSPVTVPCDAEKVYVAVPPPVNPRVEV